MRKILLINLKFLIFCLFLGSATLVLAQQPPTSGGGGNNAPKSGGYQEISVEDAGVKAAADYAVKAKSAELKEKLTVQSIEKAESQVVAGMNYRLCMVVYIPSKEPETDGVIWYIKTVVYKNLKNEYKITMWEHDDEEFCGAQQ